MLPSKEWFIDHILKTADLVVYGTIKDDSSNIKEGLDEGRTKLDVFKTLYGKELPSKLFRRCSGLIRMIYLDILVYFYIK